MEATRVAAADPEAMAEAATLLGVAADMAVATGGAGLEPEVACALRARMRLAAQPASNACCLTAIFALPQPL